MGAQGVYDPVLSGGINNQSTTTWLSSPDAARARVAFWNGTQDQELVDERRPQRETAERRDLRFFGGRRSQLWQYVHQHIQHIQRRHRCDPDTAVVEKFRVRGQCGHHPYCAGEQDDRHPEFRPICDEHGQQRCHRLLRAGVRHRELQGLRWRTANWPGNYSIRTAFRNGSARCRRWM
jgi:hypothetical protein